MSISFYEPPSLPGNERARDLAVEQSEAIHARDEKALMKVVQDARQHFNATFSIISVIHGDEQHMIAADGFHTGIYGRRLSFSGHAIAPGEDIFCVTDLSKDQRFAENPWVNGERGHMRSYAGALLRDPAGMALGALCVIHDKPQHALIESEQTILRAYASRVMTRLAALRAGSP